MPKLCPRDSQNTPLELDVRLVTQTLQRGAPRTGDGRGLLERQIARLRYQAVLGGRRVLGERAA